MGRRALDVFAEGVPRLDAGVVATTSSVGRGVVEEVAGEAIERALLVRLAGYRPVARSE